MGKTNIVKSKAIPINDQKPTQTPLTKPDFWVAEIPIPMLLIITMMEPIERSVLLVTRYAEIMNFTSQVMNVPFLFLNFFFIFSEAPSAFLNSCIIYSLRKLILNGE